jgi:hypothetical protein
MAMRNLVCEKRMNLNSRFERRRQGIAPRCANAAGAVSKRFLVARQERGYLVTSTGGVG